MATWRQADDLLDAYTAKLIARTDGIVIPRAKVDPALGLRPNFCHDNVIKWVERYPDCRIVSGWLFFDLEAIAPLLGRPPYLEYLPHAVIETAVGKLEDITPVYDVHAGLYPFLRHTGSREDYARIVDGYRIARLRVLIGPPTRVLYCDE